MLGRLLQKNASLLIVAATDISSLIDQFSIVAVDGVPLDHTQPIYLMMNKAAGVVSATKDKKNRTVIDSLLEQVELEESEQGKDERDKFGLAKLTISTEDIRDLHIHGRLDFNTTGLLLLTNDGRWSRRLSHPDIGVVKRYFVTVEQPITPEYHRIFSKGIYFPFEKITTRAASLTQTADNEAYIDLSEGRYHQIKRMFGHFQNKVLTIHRESVGATTLDPRLRAGQSRYLTADEIGNNDI